MKTSQITDIYDRVRTNWNLGPRNDPTFKTWKRYIGDLNYDEVSKIVDTTAMAGGYPPRPGELRTLTLHPNLPTPEQALVQAKQLSQAIRSGTPIPQVHPVVASSLTESGTGHDLDFKEIYRKQREQYLAQ